MTQDANQSMIARMTKAGVPRTCWSISLRDTGRANFLEFAKEVGDRARNAEQPSTAYMRIQSEAGYLEIELLSKALVQAGVLTRHMTFHKLTRDLRLQEALALDEPHPLEQIYGKGAIVIPDIPPIASVPEAQLTGYRETIDWLIGHAYEGGVLVVGGERRLSKRSDSGYPPLLTRLLVESSKQFEGA